jgi:hypothetical protein
VNKQQWRDRLYAVRDGYELERLVRRFAHLFDGEDRRTLKLIHCDEWEQVWYGVRQELRRDYAEHFDPTAPCFDTKRRLFHPIRRILMPGALMASSKAARRPNKVVTYDRSI